MPDSNPTSLQLTRTGRLVPFSSLSIGEAFYYMDAFWTRTDTHAGTDLRPRNRHASEAPAPTFGSCSFGLTEDTLMVEAVTLTFG